MSVTISGSGQIVKQVVTATSTTAVTNNTTTYATTGLTANITPTNASNKVLVTYSLPILYGSNNYALIGIKILRNSTVVQTNITGSSVSAIVISYSLNAISFLDSPATTSSTTYTIQFATVATVGAYSNTIAMDQSYGTNTGTLMLQEISGA